MMDAKHRQSCEEQARNSETRILYKCLEYNLGDNYYFSEMFLTRRDSRIKIQTARNRRSL